eukprot:EG_transcript_8134
MRVAFLHPDLGVGGAERLVVDAALGLQDRGHDVHLFTYFHSQAHCFPETADGSLPVTVMFAFIPHHVLRRGHALLANLKMALLTLRFILSGQAKEFDAVVVDQVATPLFFLRVFNHQALFYCHFPDKLCDATLTQPNRSLLRRAYRLVFDCLEEWCVGFASVVVYNSEFTKSTTLETFPSLRDHPRHDPHNEDVIYPPVSNDLLNPAQVEGLITVQTVEGTKELDLAQELAGARVLVSLNRFERKKNVELAIRTLAILWGKGLRDIRLIVAGGWDPKVAENVEYLEDLKRLTRDAGLKSCVMFMPSISAEVKKLLLQKAAVFLYTPPREHFGIVPVEAMLCGTPVVAVNFGGPRESIQHQVTGYLAEPNPLAFAQAVLYCLDHAAALGAAGKRWAISTFGQREFAGALEVRLYDVLENPPLPSISLFAGFYCAILSLFACGVAASAFLVLLRGWWRVALGGVALVPILALSTGWLFLRSLNLRKP